MTDPNAFRAVWVPPRDPSHQCKMGEDLWPRNCNGADWTVLSERSALLGLNSIPRSLHVTYRCFLSFYLSRASNLPPTSPQFFALGDEAYKTTYDRSWENSSSIRFYQEISLPLFPPKPVLYRRSLKTIRAAGSTIDIITPHPRFLPEVALH